MIDNIDELTQNEAVAYFKADLCLSDPDNYCLDEKRAICEEMAATSLAIEDATSLAIEDAMRNDFNFMPPELQGRLLDMLCASGCESEEFWKELLVGNMPESSDQLMGGGTWR